VNQVRGDHALSILTSAGHAKRTSRSCLVPTAIVVASRLFFARPPTTLRAFWGVRLLASASDVFPGLASRWSAAAFDWRLPSRSRLRCTLQALFKLGSRAAFVALFGFGASRCGLRPRPAHTHSWRHASNFSLPPPLREVILYYTTRSARSGLFL